MSDDGIKKVYNRRRVTADPPRQWEDPQGAGPVADAKPAWKLTPSERATLRYAAGLHYTSDLNGGSIRDMHVHPQFKGVEMQMLERWAKEDRWIERRHENLARWRAMIEERVGQSLMQQRMQSMQSLDTIAEQAINMLSAKYEDGALKLQPNSWEGVANFTLRLHKQLDEWRASLAESMLPDAGGQQSKQESMPESQQLLQPDEARNIAHMLMRQRFEDLEADKVKDDAEPVAAGETPTPDKGE